MDHAYKFLRMSGLKGKHRSEDEHGSPDSGLGTPKWPTYPPTSALDPTRDLYTLNRQSLSLVYEGSLPRLITWSGADERASYRLTDALAKYLANTAHGSTAPSLVRDIAYTLAACRIHLAFRRFAVPVVDSAAALPTLAKMASPLCHGQ